MAVMPFALALVFALAGGAFGVLGWRAPHADSRALLFGAAGVAVIQALTLGVVAASPSLHSTSYVVVLCLVGAALITVLVVMARRKN